MIQFIRRKIYEFFYRRALAARYPFLPKIDAQELAKFLAAAAARGELNVGLTEDAKRGVV